MDNRTFNSSTPGSQTIVGIIDADTIVWTLAYHNREESDLARVMANADQLVTSLLNILDCTHFVGLLQGPDKSFRHKWIKEYKGNRPKNPEWMDRLAGPIVTHLQSRWGFELVNGMEVDDAVATIARKLRERNTSYIVCSPDKDLDQVPGIHFNRRKGRYTIDKEQAEYIVQMQLLMGDSTDNIKGLPGIGKVKAEKIIKSTDKPYQAIMKAYIDHFGLSQGLHELGKTLVMVTLHDRMDFPVICQPVTNFIEQTKHTDNQTDQ